jgi:hypothetical protein
MIQGVNHVSRGLAVAVVRAQESLTDCWGKKYDQSTYNILNGELAVVNVGEGGREYAT